MKLIAGSAKAGLSVQTAITVPVDYQAAYQRALNK